MSEPTLDPIADAPQAATGAQALDGTLLYQIDADPHTVTMKAGETTALVAHGLGAVPEIVKVQFPPDMEVASTIVNLRADSFQVNLDHALDHDVNFIWDVVALSA